MPADTVIIDGDTQAIITLHLDRQILSIQYYHQHVVSQFHK
jgi:hypothetical protein